LIRVAKVVVSFEDCNRFVGINAEVPGCGCRVLNIYDCVPAGE